jgi:hypothetical protein
MVTHYFSISVGTGTDSTKKCDGMDYAELVFLHPVGSASQVVHSGAYGVQNSERLYFKIEWA